MDHEPEDDDKSSVSEDLSLVEVERGDVACDDAVERLDIGLRAARVEVDNWLSCGCDCCCCDRPRISASAHICAVCSESAARVSTRPCTRTSNTTRLLLLPGTSLTPSTCDNKMEPSGGSSAP